MSSRECRGHGTSLRKPTRGDRLVVLVFSLPFLAAIFPGAWLFHGQVWGWVVMGAVIGVPVVTINVLFSFSRWKTELPFPQSNTEQHKKSLDPLP